MENEVLEKRKKCPHTGDIMSGRWYAGPHSDGGNMKGHYGPDICANCGAELK